MCIRDRFRVGEDGPTHQPIEHEAQIRLMEHLRNHAGERSMVVLRPADGEETISAWRLALEEKRPVALILSRQNIKNLPALAASRREEAAQLAKGAYIVADTAKPDVVMVASGSEVATLVEGCLLYTSIPRPMKKRFGSTRPASSTQYPLGRDRLGMQAASLTAELSGIR